VSAVFLPLALIAALDAFLRGIGGLYGNAVVLEAAMPSQLLSFIMAGRCKLDEQTLAFVIMAETILAFVTLSLVQSLLPVVA
jgi:predicted permease